MTVSSIAELESVLKDAIQYTLDGEVVIQLTDDLVDAANRDVYGVYEPSVYVRRWSLANTGQYLIESGDLNVTITPEQQFNSGYGTHNSGDKLAGLVNYGDGWGGYQYEYLSFGARPFINNTVERWEGGVAKNVIAYGLAKAGLKVSG